MKKLRTLLVTFSNDLRHAPISAFRGAVIEKVGRENELFHNHDGETFVYQYPLIQYKKIKGCPGIFCLDVGVDEIHKLFSHRNWSIDLQGEKVALKVDRLDMKTATIDIRERSFEYGISNWQALNEENWPRYLQLDSMVEKIGMLEKILTANILSFAKGIDWHIDQPVKVIIKDVKQERDTRMKDFKVRTFEVDFKTNVFLPEFIGLGKGVSKGFGTVRHLNK